MLSVLIISMCYVTTVVFYSSLLLLQIVSFLHCIFYCSKKVKVAIIFSSGSTKHSVLFLFLFAIFIALCNYLVFTIQNKKVCLVYFLPVVSFCYRVYIIYNIYVHVYIKDHTESNTDYWYLWPMKYAISWDCITYWHHGCLTLYNCTLWCLCNNKISQRNISQNICPSLSGGDCSGVCVYVVGC